MNSNQTLEPQESRTPRICLFSQRNLHGLVSRCGDYEFEDIVCEVDDAELVSPSPAHFFGGRHKIANRLARHLLVSSINPGVVKKSSQKTMTFL